MSAKIAIAESALTLPRGRVSDYFELTKPRVVLIGAGHDARRFHLGGRGIPRPPPAPESLHRDGAGCWRDARAQSVRRARHRRDDGSHAQRDSLPDMSPAEALVFGVIATAGGFAYLLLATNLLCAAVTAVIAIVYLGVYTPLKRYTWMCNIIGAIPGALPPVAGWAAARGGLSWEPIVLFAIMFLWQLPHTFAVARLYRTDYARAGIHLLPRDNARGGNASNPIVIAGSLGLIAVGIIPTMRWFPCRIPYMVIGVALGIWMLVLGCDGSRARNSKSGAPPVPRVISLSQQLSC